MTGLFPASTSRRVDARGAAKSDRFRFRRARRHVGDAPSLREAPGAAGQETRRPTYTHFVLPRRDLHADPVPGGEHEVNEEGGHRHKVWSDWAVLPRT